MSKRFLHPLKDVKWPAAKELAMWAAAGGAGSLALLYAMRIFTGPAVVAVANAPYTLFPVLVLAQAMRHATDERARKEKHDELQATAYTNATSSFAYFLCQLIMYAFVVVTTCLGPNSPDESFDVDATHNVTNRVYVASAVGVVVYAAAVLSFSG